MIYVDDLNEWESGWWCHMMTDGNLEELHEMARKIGLKRAWFQPESTPHYDLRPSKRVLALKHGAQEMEQEKTVELIRLWRERAK